MSLNGGMCDSPNPKKYEKLVEATRELANFDDDSKEVEQPQLALNVKPLISQIAEIRRREFGRDLRIGWTHKTKYLLK